MKNYHNKRESRESSSGVVVESNQRNDPPVIVVDSHQSEYEDGLDKYYRTMSTNQQKLLEEKTPAFTRMRNTSQPSRDESLDKQFEMGNAFETNTHTQFAAARKNSDISNNTLSENNNI